MATKRDHDTGQEERRDVKCSICAENKKVTNAEYYCHDCQKHMCPSCSGKHDDLYETHEVVEGLGDDKDLITDKCEIHTDELIKWYCLSHEKLLCNECRLHDYSNCNIQPVKESSVELSDDPEIKQKLESAQANINTCIFTLKKHVVDIRKDETEFLRHLEDNAKGLLSRIKQLKEEDKKKIKSDQEHLRTLARPCQQACTSTKRKINQCLQKIKKGRKANIFIFKKKVHELVNGVETLRNESHCLINEHYFKFMSDKNILESLNHVSSLMTTYKTKEIDVSMQDKNCCINACCLLSSGNVVIADKNKKILKCVDPLNSKVIKRLCTRRKPLDVCCTGPQTFAVSFGSEICEYNANMKQPRVINMKHNTHKLAWHDDILYASDEKTLYVYDYNDTTKEPKKIKEDENGQELFAFIQGIALNIEGDRVYVADGNGLVCVNKEGMLIFRRDKEELRLTEAEGVTTDHRGHVLVSGWGTNNVVEVTEQGVVVGQILSHKDGIERPHCLGYNVSNKQLYVGGQRDTLLMVTFS